MSKQTKQRLDVGGVTGNVSSAKGADGRYTVPRPMETGKQAMLPSGMKAHSAPQKMRMWSV